MGDGNGVERGEPVKSEIVVRDLSEIRRAYYSLMTDAQFRAHAARILAQPSRPAPTTEEPTDGR